MADEPIRRTPPRPQPVAGVRPKIWTEGGQRPPFDLKATGRASVHFSRTGVAPIHAWAARLTRRVAVNVKNGAGRIPEARLGRFARFVPSHLRVAGWIKGLADVLSHASASADPVVTRGNALVAEIAPSLWDSATITTPEPPMTLAETEADRAAAKAALAAKADLPPPPADPLAAIRDDLNGTATYPSGSETARKAARVPRRAGATGSMATQVLGYVIGWLTVILALPYGLIRALWTFAMGTDLRRIGLDD
ncbi:MAG: hypothetical protein B7Z10_03800 [Rhodobacterales bacterium 32-66-7]|nr:MAG: hypothetical protein B7Z10_03800 [Rhodobacterales bacterium 32-66-7]